MKAKRAKKQKTGDPEFGKRLKKLREAKYKDQVDFSIAAECSVTYESQVENGWTSPTLNQIKKFAKALDMEDWEFLKKINEAGGESGNANEEDKE